MRKSLEELRRSVLSHSRDSDFFHEVTDVILVDYLNFIEKSHCFGIHLTKGSLDANIKAENLDEIKDSSKRLAYLGASPANYSRRYDYQKDIDAICVFSHYPSLGSLMNHQFASTSIISTTDFNLGKKIINQENLLDKFGTLSKTLVKDPLSLALEEDYIVKIGNGWYELHQKHLYEAAKKRLS